MLVLAAVLTLMIAGWADAGPIIRMIGGDNTTASIQATIDQFRADLGNPNNLNASGPLVSGRREINWDGGGGVSTTAPAGTPFAGFLITRGALFTTPGTGFVQATPAGLATTFSNATYSTIFSTFSPLRDFAPVGSNVTDTTFFVPGGGGIPASVRGFGAVFTDVDTLGSSRLDFFDPFGNLLLSQAVPVGTVPNGSLSFLGVTFDPGVQIARVRITSGNTALGPNDNPAGGVDVAALDDFIFAEPQQIPEPSTLALLALGSGALAGWRRWRKRATV